MTETATLYRMATDDHLCPFGLKARDLLRREGFEVQDHLLESRAETDRFLEAHDVETTPQVFIGGERVGGYDALRARFDKGEEQTDGTTFAPVLSIFGVAAVAAVAWSWRTYGDLRPLSILGGFVALSMMVLAIQKIQDLVAFQNQFITYDLLAMRRPRYAFVYPFVEAGAAVGMIAGVLPGVVGPAALFIGGVGAVSVVKAVYVDRRELKCACVGGNSRVPLGFVSLSENLAMVAMGAWMITRALT